jgi:hypothetical protein
MMDAYDIHQALFKAWQQLAHTPNAASIKKEFNKIPVYVDGREVTSVIIEDNKITLKTS